MLYFWGFSVGNQPLDFRILAQNRFEVVLPPDLLILDIEIFDHTALSPHIWHKILFVRPCKLQMLNSFISCLKSIFCGLLRRKISLQHFLQGLPVLIIFRLDTEFLILGCLLRFFGIDFLFLVGHALFGIRTSIIENILIKIFIFIFNLFWYIRPDDIDLILVCHFHIFQ